MHLQKRFKVLWFPPLNALPFPAECLHPELITFADAYEPNPREPHTLEPIDVFTPFGTSHLHTQRAALAPNYPAGAGNNCLPAPACVSASHVLDQTSVTICIPLGLPSTLKCLQQASFNPVGHVVAT